MEGSITQLAKEMRGYCFLPYYDETKEERYLSYRLEHPRLTWEEVITWVGIGIDRPFYTKVLQIKNPSIYTVLVNKYRQLPQDYIPEDLELIAEQYNDGDLVLRCEARKAFEWMCSRAELENIHLKAISTFRSFYYQQKIYDKNRTEDISPEQYQLVRDKVSARAGHSEHQTGLAVDINDLETSFSTTPEGIWLLKNAHYFGFILRYPLGKETITGYDYEPWHFRYLGIDLAKTLVHAQCTYDEYYMKYIDKGFQWS